jgi:hypothetical protein
MRFSRETTRFDQSLPYSEECKQGTHQGQEMRFSEKKSMKKHNKLFAESVPYNEAFKTLVPKVEAYVTEQRLEMW